MNPVMETLEEKAETFPSMPGMGMQILQVKFLYAQDRAVMASLEEPLL